MLFTIFQRTENLKGVNWYTKLTSKTSRSLGKVLEAAFSYSVGFFKKT